MKRMYHLNLCHQLKILTIKFYKIPNNKIKVKILECKTIQKIIKYLSLNKIKVNRNNTELKNNKRKI